MSNAPFRSRSRLRPILYHLLIWGFWDFEILGFWDWGILGLSRFIRGFSVPRYGLALLTFNLKAVIGNMG
jgi:hypothetical protein